MENLLKVVNVSRLILLVIYIYIYIIYIESTCVEKSGFKTRKPEKPGTPQNQRKPGPKTKSGFQLFLKTRTQKKYGLNMVLKTRT